MNILTSLGWYENTTADQVSICNELLSSAQDIIRKYYHSDDDAIFTEDLDDLAKEELRNNFNVDEMTNSVIRAYEDSLTTLMNNSEFFCSLGIRFDYFVNCDDSYIFAYSPDGTSISITSDDDLLQCVKAVIIDKLHVAINDYLSDKSDCDTYPKDYVEDDIEYDMIDDTDIYEFLTSNTLTQNVIRVVSENLQ